MDKSERLLRSERARKRRSNIKSIINKRTQNLYSHLHRLRIKKQNIGLVKKKKEELNKKNNEIKNKFIETAKLINNKTFTFFKESKENDELYGSIKPKEISTAIFEKMTSSEESTAAFQTLGAEFDELIKIFHPDTYGGAMLLGVKGVCIISHGSSGSLAIENAIQVAAEMAESEIVSSLKSSFS